MLPKNRAQFFRQAKNLKLTLIEHTWFPNGKLMGVSRSIEKVLTTQIMFEHGSWLMIEKTDTIRFNGDTMTIDLQRDGKFKDVMVYQMVEK